MVARLFAVALLCLVSVAALSPQAASAQEQRCFSETGYCISGPIRTYWERNGGLAVFGFPISQQRQETIEGRAIQVQWFERDRLEIQADGTLTAGRLGARLLELQGRPWERFPKETPATAASPECSYFAVTGFNVCLGIRTYWERNGGLERFGYPISPVMGELIEGKVYSVQYFERRRIEIHPENAAPYDILLGLLGRDVLALSGGSPTGGAPTADVLSGTTWQWTGLTDPLQQVTIPDPSRYTITFSQGALSIQADCNRAQGGYSLGSDGAMSIQIGPVTAAACVPGSRGDEFVRKLGAVSRFSFQGSTLLLELVADGGTLSFTRP
jgi:heat shock protein HslJ